jgi:hypothetical protein
LKSVTSGFHRRREGIVRASRSRQGQNNLIIGTPSTEQIAGTSVNRYSSQASLGSTAWSALIAATQ